MRRGTCRDSAHELLPWFLNGSLEGEEEASVSAHVQGCQVCSRELRELADVTSAMTGQSLARAQQARRAPQGRLPYLLAASLVLPAVLGLYWAYLGFPRGEATPAAVVSKPVERRDLAVLHASTNVDLGPGLLRGDAPLPRLVISPDIEWVVVTLFAPAVSGSRPTLELQDADGKALARGQTVRSDALGRCTYAFPADTLHGSGEHAIVIMAETGPQGSTPFRYPFLVEFPLKGGR